MARPPGYRRPVEKRTHAALIRSRGNLSAAAEILGCSRQNVVQTIDRYPALQKLCSDLLEEEIDKHEATLRKMAIEKEVPVAVLAFLNNKARHRSWGRPADDASTSALHLHRHLHVGGGGMPERLSKLSDQELSRLLEERRRAIPPDGGRLLEGRSSPVKASDDD